MKLKDLLLVEAGMGVDNLSFGPSGDDYHLVINFSKTILDNDAAHKAIEGEFDELISGILSSYDACDYAWKEDDRGEAKGYEKEFTADGKKLKAALQAAIKAGTIPGIDKTTKVVEIEHPGIS